MSGIIINEDDSHYFADRGLSGANIEKLKEMVSHYCQGQVDEVMYCFMAQRASVGGLNVDPIWAGMEEKEDGLLEKIATASNPTILEKKVELEESNESKNL